MAHRGKASCSRDKYATSIMCLVRLTVFPSHDRYACYGATKRGLPQLTESLVRELDEGVQGYAKKVTPGKVQVHNLSPGMVFTKLLLDDSTPELRKFPFGVLAAQPEEVAADLVPKILATTKNGGSVEVSFACGFEHWLLAMILTKLTLLLFPHHMPRSLWKVPHN